MEYGWGKGQDRTVFRREALGTPFGPARNYAHFKPAITGSEDHDLNEHIRVAAAWKLGLRAVASSVIDFIGERAIVVERYDRRLTLDGRIMRIHQEDLC